MARLVALAIAISLGACAPRTLQCNQEPTFWASGRDGKISTQIKVCFRDDGSLGYKTEPFVPPPPKAPEPQPWVDAIKKLEAQIEERYRGQHRDPEPPKISDEAMAAKKAAAAKLK